MGTTAEKINRLTQTKSDLKTVINYTGANITDETTFKEYPKLLNKAYIDILNNGTDNLYEALPKTTVTGSNLDLDTEEGKMKLIPKAVQIEQATRILPSEYTQVDYVEGHRGEYIDTGFEATPKTRIEATFQFTQVTPVQQRILGNAYSETDGFILTTYINGSGNFAWACQNNVGNWTNTGIIADTNKHTFIVDSLNNSVSIDNYNATITATRTNSSINTMLLFAYRGNGTTASDFSYLKMYSTKIYDNGVLVRDFIPCYRNSDSAVGMYDLVNNVFYTNQGTGAFTYGSIVNIPNSDYPQDIEVVTGEQNIKNVGKNLFDKDNINILNGYLWQNQMVLRDTLTDRIFYISCQPNTTYTISRSVLTSSFRVATYNDAIPTVTSERLVYTCYNEINNNDGTTITITTDSNSKYLLVMYANVNNDTNIEESLASIQIEIGTTATEYVEHQEQNYPITLSSKNLFNTDDFIVAMSTNYQGIVEQDNKNCIVLGRKSSSITDYIYSIDCKENTQYTISFEYILSNCVIYFKYSDNTTSIISNASTSEITKINATSTIGKTLIGLGVGCYGWYDSGSKILITNIQLEEGSTATEYEPYYNIEYCKIGDYADQISNEFESKNLFDYHWFGTSKDILWQYYYETLGQNDFRAIPIYIGISNYATFSTNVPQTSPSLLYAINDINLGSSVDSPLNSTVVRTIQANAEGYVYLGFVNTRQYYTDVVNGTYYIQIETGQVATEYIPYGIIKGEWYLKKNIIKHIFDGDSIKDDYIYSTDLANVLAINLEPNKVEQALIKPRNTYALYSDKFTYINNVNNIEHIYISQPITISTGWMGNIRLYINHDRLEGYSSSLTNDQKRDLLINWLQQNPLTIYYIARYPEYIHISQEDYPVLREQLENLYNNAKSYEDKTYITVTNDNEENLLLELDVSALAKIE